jgi:hypothetical protein
MQYPRPGQSTSPVAERVGTARCGSIVRRRSSAVRVLLASLRLESTFAGAVVLTACLAAILWALVLPYHAAPDEAAHFNIDWFIAVHNDLPVLNQSPEVFYTFCASPEGPCYSSYASVPPGGPLLGAALMKLQHAVTGRPYAELVGAARFASVLCFAVYVVFLRLIVWRLVPDHLVRLTALMIGAFIPQVTYLGGYVNDDSIGLAAGTVLLYLGIRILQDGLDGRLALSTGIALGVLVLGKTNYYVTVLPFAPAVLARFAREWRAGRAARFIGLLALSGGVGIALCGWWIARSYRLYGDPFGVSAFYRSFYEVAPSYKEGTIAGQGGTVVSMLLDRTTPWWQYSFISFWGQFDQQYLGVNLSLVAYAIILVGALLSVGGMLMSGLRYRSTSRGLVSRDRWRGLVATGLAGLLAATIAQSLWTSLTHVFQPQGRYLFPGLVPVVLFLAVGLHGWSARREHRSVIFACVALLMLLLNVYAFMFAAVPAYGYYSATGQ